MDKHYLMGYQKLKQEQELLARRIDALCAREIPVVKGIVKASSKNFPYTEHRISVQMDEPVRAERIIQMLRIYKERQKKVEQQMLKIETFIDRIDDTEIRQIFELRFVEGWKLREVAEKMNQDRSGIGKKINNFLQLSHNSQKSML